MVKILSYEFLNGSIFKILNFLFFYLEKFKYLLQSFMFLWTNQLFLFEFLMICQSGDLDFPILLISQHTISERTKLIFPVNMALVLYTNFNGEGFGPLHLFSVKRSNGVFFYKWEDPFFINFWNALFFYFDLLYFS